jgi:hypothetical protein
VRGVAVAIPRDDGTVLKRARVQKELAPKRAHFWADMMPETV